ncbi:MAG: hypothetical protein ACRDPD_02755 [Streptosporangiaceae bacterium]
MKFRNLISQVGKPLSTSEALINRPTKWIAEKFGVSRRTAQRWKKGTQQPSPRVGGPDTVIKDSTNADTRKAVAANAIRNAQAAHVGRVSVVDKSPRGNGPKPGKNFRNLKVVNFSEREREQMSRAADALERGDTEQAERLMNDAIMGAYGGGADSALSIEDWPPGFHLI